MEEFVTYERAVKLKELGFNEPCRYYYNSNQQLSHVKECALSPEATNNHYLDEISDRIAIAPTLSQAAKYLREEIGVDIIVGPQFNSKTGDRIGYFWKCSQRTDVKDNITYKTFEKALSAGIDEALKLIENKQL